jgi:hypothetical protein
VGLADLDVDQPGVVQRALELGAGQRAGDAAGPLLHVGARGVVHLRVGDHIGDGEPAAGAQDARGLTDHTVLVGGEVDDAVGDDDERYLLPLAELPELASRLSQAEIGSLYVGMSLVVSATAAGAGRLRPRPILLASTALIVLGLSLAGATSMIPMWVLALGLAAVGIGLANTGSLGVLVETVRPTRIMTAMVAWSQIGIVGYLLGPAVGGAITQSLGFPAIALLPLACAAALLALGRRSRAAAEG